MLARAFAVLEELHIGFDATLPRLHLLVHEMLDQPIGRALPRHVFGLDHVRPRRVFGAELLGSHEIVGEKAAGGGAGQRSLFVFEWHRLRSAYMSVGGLKSSWPGGSLSVGHSTIFWNRRCMNRNSGLALNTRRMQSSFSSSLKCWCTQPFSTSITSPASHFISRPSCTSWP